MGIKDVFLLDAKKIFLSVLIILITGNLFAAQSQIEAQANNSRAFYDAQRTNNIVKDSTQYLQDKYQGQLRFVDGSYKNTVNAIQSADPYSLNSGYTATLLRNIGSFGSINKEIIQNPYLSDKNKHDWGSSLSKVQTSYMGGANSLNNYISGVQDEIHKAEEKAKSQMLTKIGVGVVLAVVTVASGGLAATGASATLNAIGTVGTYSSFATTALDIRNFSVLQNKGLYAFGQEMKQTSGLSTGLSVTSAVGGVANLYQSAGKFGDEATKQGNKVTELSKEFSVSNAAKIADAKSLQTVYQVKEITAYTQMGVKAASVPQIINPKVYGKDYNRVTAGISGVTGITDLTYTGPAISKTYYNQDKPLMEKVSVVPSKFAYTSFNPVSVVSITADIKYATTGKNLFAERHQAGASAIMQVADAGYSTAQKIVLNYRVNQASERADNRVEGLMNINAKPGEIKMTEGYETYKYVTDNPSPRDKMATKIKFYESLERNTYLPMPIYQKFENRYSVVDAKIEKPITYNSMMFKTGTGIDTNMGLSSLNNFNVK